MKIRTRFAPSPTGYLHIGGLRTALYNYFFAKKHGGTFILRIEDTDQTRLVPGATESLIKTLQYMGLMADEGPTLNGEIGEYGPYVQSSRAAIYQEHARTLLEKGAAYYCFCSEECLATKRQEQKLAKLPTKYDRSCLNLAPEEIQAKLAAGEKFVVRLRVPEGATEFDDLIRGHVKFENLEIDDQVLIKSDGLPTYHLANVVDDHLMKISHVIRAEEWLSSTPKHIILYKMFGWEAPEFAHLPMALNPDRSKLSKRQGDVAVEDFLAKGYLPAALNNFVALLGFNPRADQEIYSMDELIALFDLEKVNKSGAIFDMEKLKWMNGQYIHKLSVEKLTTLCSPYLIGAGPSTGLGAGKTVSDDLLRKICAVEQTRLVLLSDIIEKINTYQKLPDYSAGLLVWKKSSREEALEQLKKIIPLVETLDLSSVELIERVLREYIVNSGSSNGAVLWPLRSALSGADASPGPFELLWVLGREESLVRLNHAVKLLSV